MKIRMLPALLLLAACESAPVDDVVIDDGVSTTDGSQDRDYRIINGHEATRPEHDAVVMIIKQQGPWYYFWCSGSLLNDSVVLTAGHCQMKTDQAVVFVGTDWDDPGFEDHLYFASRTELHPEYNAGQLTQDLFLIELEQPVTEVSNFLPPLPASLGFTDADAGMMVDHAGFGDDEDGNFGHKLHFETALGGLGSYLDGNPYRDTQVWYDMPIGGPCFGDSGGPMIVTRGGQNYVGSVTSYGDMDCAEVGANTRVDANEDWIAGFMGDGGDGGGPGTCDLAGKHESCDVDADCCSRKCRGKKGAKTCK